MRKTVNSRIASRGKAGILSNGDKALVLCELSEMLGSLDVVPKLSTVQWVLLEAFIACLICK